MKLYNYKFAAAFLFANIIPIHAANNSQSVMPWSWSSISSMVSSCRSSVCSSISAFSTETTIAIGGCLKILTDGYFTIKNHEAKKDNLHDLIENAYEKNALKKESSYYGHADPKSQLIKLGITNINEELLRDGESALHFASREGHLEIAKRLLESGANIEATDYLDETPLHVAAKNGKNTIVQLLLEYGANIESTNQLGATPLYSASLPDNTDTIILLLKAGANVETKDYRNKSPLQEASAYGYCDVVKVLLNYCENEKITCDLTTLLRTASGLGNSGVVEILLDHGADANTQYQDGIPLLHYAAERKHFKIVESLLRHGAETETPYDKTKLTLLHLASYSGSNQITESLLKHGTEIESTGGKKPITALQLAFTMKHSETVKLLLNRGADTKTIDSNDKDNNTAFCEAIGLMHPEWRRSKSGDFEFSKEQLLGLHHSWLESANTAIKDGYCECSKDPRHLILQLLSSDNEFIKGLK